MLSNLNDVFGFYWVSDFNNISIMHGLLFFVLLYYDYAYVNINLCLSKSYHIIRNNRHKQMGTSRFYTYPHMAPKTRIWGELPYSFVIGRGM